MIMRAANKELWVPDQSVSHCAKCGTAFSLWTRRHHCRECGQVYCGNCLDVRWMLSWYIQRDGKKLCYDCAGVAAARAHDEGTTELPPLRPSTLADIALSAVPSLGSFPSCVLPQELKRHLSATSLKAEPSAPATRVPRVPPANDADILYSLAGDRRQIWGEVQDSDTSWISHGSRVKNGIVLDNEGAVLKLQDVLQKDPHWDNPQAWLSGDDPANTSSTSMTPEWVWQCTRHLFQRVMSRSAALAEDKPSVRVRPTSVTGDLAPWARAVCRLAWRAVSTTDFGDDTADPRDRIGVLAIPHSFVCSSYVIDGIVLQPQALASKRMAPVVLRPRILLLDGDVGLPNGPHSEQDGSMYPDGYVGLLEALYVRLTTLAPTVILCGGGMHHYLRERIVQSGTMSLLLHVGSEQLHRIASALSAPVIESLVNVTASDLRDARTPLRECEAFMVLQYAPREHVCLLRGFARPTHSTILVRGAMTPKQVSWMRSVVLDAVVAAYHAKMEYSFFTDLRRRPAKYSEGHQCAGDPTASVESYGNAAVTLNSSVLLPSTVVDSTGSPMDERLRDQIVLARIPTLDDFALHSAIGGGNERSEDSPVAARAERSTTTHPHHHMMTHVHHLFQTWIYYDKRNDKSLLSFLHECLQRGQTTEQFVHGKCRMAIIASHDVVGTETEPTPTPRKRRLSVLCPGCCADAPTSNDEMDFTTASWMGMSTAAFAELLLYSLPQSRCSSCSTELTIPYTMRVSMGQRQHVDFHVMPIFMRTVKLPAPHAQMESEGGWKSSHPQCRAAIEGLLRRQALLDVDKVVGTLASHEETIRCLDSATRDIHGGGSERVVAQWRESLREVRATEIDAIMHANVREWLPTEVPWHPLCPRVCDDGNLSFRLEEPTSLIAMALRRVCQTMPYPTYPRSESRDSMSVRHANTFLAEDDVWFPIHSKERAVHMLRHAADAAGHGSEVVLPKLQTIVFEVPTALAEPSGVVSITVDVPFPQQFIAMQSLYMNGAVHDLILSLTRCTTASLDGGKTHATCHTTLDGRFFVKEIKRPEYHFFFTCGARYLEHMGMYYQSQPASVDEEHGASSMAKILGIYALRVEYAKGSRRTTTQGQRYVLLMERLRLESAPSATGDVLYDLKGFVRRWAEPSSRVLWDGNMLNEMQSSNFLFCRVAEKMRLMKTLQRDTEFLAAQGLVDYSLTLAVSSRRVMAPPEAKTKVNATDASGEEDVLSMGLVDFLQPYDRVKRAETFVKRDIAHALWSAQAESTIVPPSEYQARFMRWVRLCVCAVPDRATVMDEYVDTG